MLAVIARTRPVVVAVSGDPGGANAVAPVIELLQSEGRVAVKAFAYREALTLWRKRGIQVRGIPEDLAIDAAGQVLDMEDASLLLAGTSMNTVDLEKRFIMAARRRGTPSLAVLDFWSNYSARFADQNGRLVYLPDLVAVMDAAARDEMVAEGVDSNRLIITGQPAFDDLSVWRSRFSPERRRAAKEALNTDQIEKLVLFVSQPLSSLYGTDPESPRYLGYTESSVLEELVEALERIAETRKLRIVLAVRPHPREKAESFASLRSDAIRAIVVTEGESRDLVMAADLVAGMNSMLLVDACYLSCPTISLQPGLRLPDSLPTNRLGLSRAVYQKEDLQPALEAMLLDMDARLPARNQLSHLWPGKGASERVTRLLYQMAGLGI